MCDNSHPTESVAPTIDTTVNDMPSTDFTTRKRTRSYESVVGLHADSFIRVLTNKKNKKNKHNEGSLVTNEPISHSQPTKRTQLKSSKEARL